MLDTAKYTNSNGESITFGSGGVYLKSALPLRGYEWKYSSNFEELTGFYKGITEKEFTLIINAQTKAAAYAKRNSIFAIFDVDVLNETPGKLQIGEYYCEGFMIASDKKERSNNDRTIKCEFTFVSDAPEWVRETTYYFDKTDPSGNSVKKYSYSYDFYYDTNPNATSEGDEDTGIVATNDAISTADFVLTIYGEISKPAVLISGNTYQVNVDLAEGETLEVNSLNKTIYVIDADGAKTNAFWQAAKSSYIFEKIPVGDISIEWSGGFAFDLTVLERRSEPKWA